MTATAIAESRATTVSDDVLQEIFDKPSVDKSKIGDYSEAVKDILASISSASPDRLHFTKNAELTIMERIAQIDRAISKQLSAVMHHEEFQKTEAAWRGLDYLLKRSETGPMLKVKFMQFSKEELADDVVNATRFDQSQLFRKLYEEEFGTAGGKPFGILVGDYQFGPKPQDMLLLGKIAETCASAMCPFIASADPEMFKLKDFTELGKWPILSQVFESPEFVDWNNLRDHPDSRYVVLTLPRVMSRLPYGPNTTPVKAFDFREMEVDEKGRNSDLPHDAFAWMNSAFAHAACVTRAFSKYNWCGAIRGVEGGGKVEGLPTYVYVDEKGGLAQKCPSEVSITDRREKELSDLGFIALCHYKQENYSAFFGGQSIQRPALYSTDVATANARLAARIPYMLAVSRVGHYLKAIARDRIGSYREASDLERELKQWISKYVCLKGVPTHEDKAKQPFKAAEVKVEEDKRNPGSYKASLHVVPWFQFEDVAVELSAVVRIPPPQK